VGERAAIYIARGLHVLTIFALAVTGLGAHLGVLYWCGLAIAAIILLYEHSLVHPGNLTRLDAAFFMMNGMLSIRCCSSCSPSGSDRCSSSAGTDGVAAERPIVLRSPARQGSHRHPAARAAHQGGGGSSS
jgi:hypothetical protein